MKLLFVISIILFCIVSLSCSSNKVIKEPVRNQDKNTCIEKEDELYTNDDSLIEQVLNDSTTKYIYAIVATKEGLIKVTAEILRHYNYEFDLYKIVFMKEVTCNQNEKYQFFILILNKTNRHKSDS